MATPHINAGVGDLAEICLVPGDPLRAQHIATTFLDDARQVTDVRNMLGFTGSYRGVPISTMGSGMGIPSASIYYKELITEYQVSTLVRVGSCGGIAPNLGLRDVVIAIGAGTDSHVNRTRFGGHDFPATADYSLVHAAVHAADSHGIPVTVGNLFSSDLFYNPDPHLTGVLRDMGILGVEMEAAGLYGVAAEYGAKALTIVTVSDLIFQDEATSSDDRETTFDDMVQIALDAVVQLHS